MIDGIKIAKLVSVEVARKLMENSMIDFCQKTSISTGEITPGEAIEAKYNGLTFRLSPETNGGGFWLVVRGSLHRFYNDGGTNGNDFFYWQFKEAIMKIETLLNIPVNDFIIRNFEFGANLETELTAAKYIRSLVFDGNKAFADFNINDNYLGKQCTRQDTTLKIYDKGKQERNGNKRLLRVELRFNRMRLLVDQEGRYKISTVADLLNVEKLGVLGQELANRWEQIIFYDGGIDESMLTNAERLRLWKYRSPQYWDELTRSKRYKSRLKFEKLMSEKCTRQTQKEIKEMILSKCAELINMQHKNGSRLTQFENENEAQKRATFDTIQCTCLLSPQTPQEEKEKIQEKIQVEKRFCEVCEKDISHRKKTALTCCRKCRNAKSNQARRERTNRQRERERVLFQEVCRKLRYEPLKVSVWKTGIKRAKVVYTNTIKPMKYKERRRVTRVRGSCGGVPFELTGMRAKEFIKYCQTNN